MNSSATLSDKVKYVIDKITTKLHKPVENIARAKLIVRYTRELRALISENERDLDTINALVHAHNAGGYLMVSYTKILKYALLADETLRCLLPIIRQSSDTTKLIISQLVEHGAVVFALNALRYFDKHDGIKVQALELLACVVSFVADPGNTPSILTAQELVHQLVLNGSTSTLPALLTFYADTKNDLSTRRTIECIMFLLKNSPREVAMTLITVNNWAVVRAGVQILKLFTPTSQVKATELLIGLLVCSPVSGDKLLQFGGLQDMMRVIVENPTNLKVHFSWSKKAMINVLSLAKMSVGAKQDAYVQLIKALQTIVELGVIKVDIENAQTRGSFPFRQDSGESISKQPSEDFSLLSNSEFKQSHYPDTEVLSPKKKVTVMDRIQASPLNQIVGTGEALESLPKIAHASSANKKQSMKKSKSTMPKGLPTVKNLHHSVKFESEFDGLGPKDIAFAEPEDLLKTVGAVQKVASRLFDTDSNAATANSGIVGDEGAVSSGHNKLSSVDQLSYAERLQVMIMQVQDVS